MEKMSILNLFNFTGATELPKTPDNSKGEFESVFKKYLDRSEPNKPQNTSGKANEASKPERTDDAKDSETPEEVIDSLNISKEKKAELKKQLSEAKTPKEISEFLDNMMSMMKDAGDSLKDIENTLAELAMTLLTKQEDNTSKDNVMLEQTLDKIVEVQDEIKTNAPQLSVVKPQQTQNAQANQQNQAKQAENSGGQENEEARKEVFMPDSNDSEELSDEIKEKVINLASKHADQKNQNTDMGQGFEAKTDLTEKVIKTEIKIESPKDIMKFAELVELAKSQQATKLNIQLNPQELGKVNIELTEHAGKVSGKVIFESETAKNLFASNADGLRQQLAEKGVIVENLEFLFKDFDQHEFAGWNGKEGRKSGNSNSQDTFADSGEEEADDKDLTDGIYA